MRPAPLPPGLLTRTGVAERLNCSTTTVRHMQERGELVPAERRRVHFTDGVDVFDESDVERLANNLAEENDEVPARKPYWKMSAREYADHLEREGREGRRRDEERREREARERDEQQRRAREEDKRKDEEKRAEAVRRAELDVADLLDEVTSREELRVLAREARRALRRNPRDVEAEVLLRAITEFEFDDQDDDDD